MLRTSHSCDKRHTDKKTWCTITTGMARILEVTDDRFHTLTIPRHSRICLQKETSHHLVSEIHIITEKHCTTANRLPRHDTFKYLITVFPTFKQFEKLSILAVDYCSWSWGKKCDVLYIFHTGCIHCLSAKDIWWYFDILIDNEILLARENEPPAFKTEYTHMNTVYY